MNNARRARLAKAAALTWPILCALMTISVSDLLRERVTWPVFYQVRDAVWWINAVLAIAGSATACVATARSGERTSAAIGFAAWAAVAYLIALSIYAAIEPARR